jgi:hypothetical protein
VPAGIVLIVIFGPRTLRNLAGRIALFGVAASVVVLPWLVHNLDSETVTGSLLGTTPGIGPTTKKALIDLGQLVVPSQLPNAVSAALVAATAIVFVSLWLYSNPPWRSVVNIIHWPVVGGALIGVVTLASVTGSSDVNSRILAPAFPALVLSGLWLLGISRQRVASRAGAHVVRVSFVAGLVGVLALSLVAVVAAWRNGSHGRGYAAPAVRDSAIVQAARAVPNRTTILTDDGLPIAYWTGRVRLLDIGDSFAALPATTAAIERAVCAGPVTYMRLRPRSDIARSFEIGVLGQLTFERVRTVSNVEVFRVVAANPSRCTPA